MGSWCWHFRLCLSLVGHRYQHTPILLQLLRSQVIFVLRLRKGLLEECAHAWVVPFTLVHLGPTIPIEALLLEGACLISCEKGGTSCTAVMLTPLLGWAIGVSVMWGDTGALEDCLNAAAGTLREKQPIAKSEIRIRGAGGGGRTHKDRHQGKRVG